MDIKYIYLIRYLNYIYNNNNNNNNNNKNKNNLLS